MKTKLSKEDYLNQIREGVVYIYTNLVNGKKYVGQTSKQVGYKNRFLIHCKCIENPGSCIFHKALKKYGVNNFELVLVEDNIPEELVDNKEKEYIMKYNTFLRITQDII